MKAGDRVIRTDTGEHGVITALKPAYEKIPALARFVGDHSGEQGYVHLGAFVLEDAYDVVRGDVGSTVDVVVQPWPLKTSPEVYLARYPDGKHADLARLHV